MGMKRDLSADLVRGVVAGALATWSMERLSRRASPGRARADDRGDEPRRARLDAGRALRWATGMGAGALYAAARKRLGLVGRGPGLGLGAGFFLFIDEAAAPLLRRAPDGAATMPWKGEVRGVSGHLIFSIVTDATLGVLDVL